MQKVEQHRAPQRSRAESWQRAGAVAKAAPTPCSPDQQEGRSFWKEILNKQEGVHVTLSGNEELSNTGGHSGVQRITVWGPLESRLLLLSAPWALHLHGTPEEAPGPWLGTSPAQASTTMGSKPPDERFHTHTSPF